MKEGIKNWKRKRNLFLTTGWVWPPYWELNVGSSWLWAEFAQENIFLPTGQGRFVLQGRTRRCFKSKLTWLTEKEISWPWSGL
jgi:hypothetical protein